MSRSRSKLVGAVAIGVLVMVGLVFLLIVLPSFQLRSMQGKDMEPTFNEGDRILVTKGLGPIATTNNH